MDFPPVGNSHTSQTLDGNSVNQTLEPSLTETWSLVQKSYSILDLFLFRLQAEVSRHHHHLSPRGNTCGGLGSSDTAHRAASAILTRYRSGESVTETN